MGDAESCGSRAADYVPGQTRNNWRSKVEEVYNQVLFRLKDTNNVGAASPGFDDDLWAHFQRLPASYALEVNPERAENVLLHKRSLEMARDHATRPIIEVCLIQLPAMEGNGDSSHSPSDTEVVWSDNPSRLRLMHEITISTSDIPKLRSQLISILIDIGLNIEEAHAFSTVDGYSLNLFIINNWAAEETDELRHLLVKEISKIKSICGNHQRRKVKVYNEVLWRLKDTNVGDAASPGFDDELWDHFQRLPTRYALDVNPEMAEDVLLHKRLLEMAHDPVTRPAIEVRIVQIPAMKGNGGDSLSPRNTEVVWSDNPSRLSMNPPPAFDSFTDHELMYDKDFPLVASPLYPRLMHEITISTSCSPKCLSQLTSMLAKIGLNIQEARAFSTVDGYSLNLFIVSGWAAEETDQLRRLLVNEISKIKASFVHEKVQAGNGHISNRINIPADRLDVWEIDMNMLKYENKIASGLLGDLYKGTFCSQDVAIKVLRTDHVTEELRREFAQEVFIMRKVRHKNVVQFIGACTRPPSFCIVTEFMSGGRIYDYLHKQKRSFDLQSLIRVAIDVSKGMNYLHQSSIIHRDLKTANLFMDENKVVKVADFGVARVQDQSGVMTAETGTYLWMAPEVLEHKPYDHKADVFSFGIVLWELHTAKLPYEHLTPIQAAVGVVQQDLRPSIPEDTHRQLVYLIEQCWQRDPRLRPDFSEILQLLQQLAATVAEELEETQKSRQTFTVAKRAKH